MRPMVFYLLILASQETGRCIMPRFKKLEGDKLTVEIHKLTVVKERCAGNKETVKDYLNRLVRQDMMRAGEYFSIRYFKEL